jgi:hypothetical protein
VWFCLSSKKKEGNGGLSFGRFLKRIVINKQSIERMDSCEEAT